MLTPKVKIATEGNVKVLSLNGEFIGGKETDQLQEVLNEEAKAETPRLLIDLGGATYLNSTSLGVLIAAHTNFAKRGGKVGLCNVSKNIENIFVITKLSLVFTIFGTREEGIKGMQS